MIRTQIQLDEAACKEIKRIAYEQGKSMSAVARELLDRSLKRKEKPDKKLTGADFPFIGKYRSGESDISERHDDYLAEDFK